MEEIIAAVQEVLDRDDDPWASLCSVLHELAERQAADELTGRAYELVADDRDVGRMREAMTTAFEELLARARAQGRLRRDADGQDVLLLFAATRAARSVDPAGWRRVLELFIDALGAADPSDAALSSRAPAASTP